MNRLQLLKQTMKKSVIGDWFIRNMGLPDSDTTILDRAYEMSDLVYICVSTTARAISQVPLLLGTVNSKGEWEELNNPADAGLMNLISRPNYLMDYSSFIEAIVSFLLLDGNAWVIPYPPDDAVPISWWVVPRKYIEPLRNEQTGQLEAWHYKPSESNAFRLEISQVAQIFFWNPYDPLIGFAPLQAGKLSITTDYKAAKFNQIFFDQGATIGGVLSSEQNLNDAQVKRLKEEIDKKYSGYDKAHRMLILEGGLKYTQTAFSHKDILFPEVRGLDKERVLQIFGMKKAILSVTDDLNKATAWQQEKAWWTGTNIPIMRMIESAFNFTYFDQMGIEARFDLASIEALHRDFSDKVETAGKLVKIGFTPNEVNQRLELGFEDADWRDYIWKPSSERAIGEDAPAVLEERPDEPIVIEPPEEPELLPAPEEEEIVIAKIELKPDFQQRGERIWKDMVKQARPIEKIFKSKTRKMFFQWRNLVLNWFYEQAEKSLKDSDKPFIMNRPLTDINELSIQPFDDLKAAADVLYEKTLMTGLETIAIEIGEVLDIDILSLADAQAFLLDKGIDLKGLVETQAKQLRASLSIGMEKGESLDELAARIRWKFKNAANRALTIARTEVYGSLNFGRNTTIKETKYRKVQWFTSMDEKVRKTHARMHAKKKGIRESWIVGGSSLRYPGDPMGAAGEIINCRCIEVVALGSLSDN